MSPFNFSLSDSIARSNSFFLIEKFSVVNYILPVTTEVKFFDRVLHSSSGSGSTHLKRLNSSTKGV